MDVKVRFRFNKATGEVEMFQVDDQGSRLPEAEHNREHDRVAREIGSLVERNPLITEHTGVPPQRQPAPRTRDEDEPEPAPPEPQRRRE